MLFYLFFLDGCVVGIEVKGVIELKVVENKLKMDLWEFKF